MEEEANYFEKTPKPLIIEISDYLYGKNFFSFCSSCKKIHNTLRESKKFSIPEKEEALDIIKNTPFHHLTTLLANWERTDKSKTIPLLRKMKNEFQDFYPHNNKKSLESYDDNFDTYFKIINLLYGMGDVKCEEIYKNLYRTTHEKFYTAKGSQKRKGPFLHPNLYIFYYEKLALLDPHMIQYLIEDSQEDTPIFKKLKVGSFSQKFALPLSSNILKK